MCILLLGIGVDEDRPLILAANRDEYYDRPSTPPQVVSCRPRIIAGLDRRSGGTWLGLNEVGVVAALTNRHVASRAVLPSAPSRGGLPLTALEAETARDGIEAAASLARRNVYNPFTLITADRDGAWLFAVPGEPVPVRIARGWHVLANRLIDDRSDARVRRAVGLRRRLVPASGRTAEWISALSAFCADHGTGPAANVSDALCVHGEAAGTVSASIIMLGRDGSIVYHHADGPPCSTAFESVDIPW